MNVFIKMFDDKLVIESPGGFPPTVTPENIYGAHHPRNPHLMDAMFYLDFVKEHGEGARRIRDTMAKSNLPFPEFKQTETGTGATSVRVTLRNNAKQRTQWVDSDLVKLLGETVLKTLSEDERRILNSVMEHRKINVCECLRLVPRLPKWHAADKLLKSMVNKGYLVRIYKRPRDPHGHYARHVTPI